MMPPQQVALITGGARGIGRAIAERFLMEKMTVVIADRNRSEGGRTAADLKSLGPISFIPMDVSREADVRKGVLALVRRHKRLDVLVNNAGIVNPVSGFDSKRWRAILDVNLTGAFYCSKYVVPHLQKVRGCIVNVSSIRALMSEPDTPAYSASKGGLVALTHSLAITLGPSVRVNGIGPGWIDTGIAPVTAKDHRHHPVGRVGRAEDIAALAYFLVSPDAAFITGQTFIADGGITRKMIF